MQTKNRYVDALIDSGFKAIFGKPGYSEEILKGFLNTLYQGEPGFEPISKVEFKNPIQDPVPVKGKTIIHDVICETEQGHRFILEMQRARKDDFIPRSTYYTCRGVTEQVSLSADVRPFKYKFLPVTSVYICNFMMDCLEKKLKSHFMFRDTETGHYLQNGIRMAYVQLPMFKKEWEGCDNKFEQWIFLMKNMHKLQEFPAASLKDEIFARLEKVANYANLTREEQAVYEADLRWISEYDEEMATGKREALEQGFKQGRAEGIAEGRAEGRAEGELQKAIEVAKTAIGMGLDDNAVSKLSGLSIQEIQKLR
ncbi:MAG: Rpn family recombination-promoting nuclease/putative transposase [Muribaculaceae bacterium]|nr:Rpn family recombination-promoting nuclease/putative transposase [Muribaculaceae bacterium]